MFYTSYHYALNDGSDAMYPQTIPDEEMTITNYMVTNSVTAANSGRYTCTVSTSVNFATLNYNVTVQVISPFGK